MNNPKVVVVTRPIKAGDPTLYTSQWCSEAIRMMADYGYTIVDIKANEVDYDTVSTYIEHYNPGLYVHFGHGCVNNLMGQNECCITNGLGLTDLDDSCSIECRNPDNTHLLKGTIVLSVACYSAASLGRYAVQNGCTCYVGYRDTLLFPVDSMGSQDMFRNTHLIFLKYLLTGHTVADAERAMKKYEDEVITKNKTIKYVALPMLFDQVNREIIGNAGARLWY